MQIINIDNTAWVDFLFAFMPFNKISNQGFFYKGLCQKKNNTDALWFLEHMISLKYRVDRNISLSFYKKLLFWYQYEEISRDAYFK